MYIRTFGELAGRQSQIADGGASALALLRQGIDFHSGVITRGYERISYQIYMYMSAHERGRGERVCMGDGKPPEEIATEVTADL